MIVRMSPYFDTSVFIDEVEVFYISFPRYKARRVLDDDCQERIKLALKVANEIVERFINDGRLNPTAEELKKAFNRTYESYLYG